MPRWFLLRFVSVMVYPHDIRMLLTVQKERALEQTTGWGEVAGGRGLGSTLLKGEAKSNGSRRGLDCKVRTVL